MTKSKTPSEEFGDVEFEYTLEEFLDEDPIGRLGFDPDKAEVFKSDRVNAIFMPSFATTQHSEENTARHFPDAMTVVPPDHVGMSSSLAASSGLWVHEYRHRGLDQLFEMYREDPEYFRKQYGWDAEELLLNTQTFGPMNEMVTELRDSPFAEWNDSSGQRQNNVGFLDFASSLGDIKTVKQLRRGEEVFFETDEDEMFFKGFMGLEKAAEDMLNKRQDELKGYAEGGEVMKKDPVSGNPIPPGGTAEGVRDDIDIKVSEGEYIIPANVVKYIGVEKLRSLHKKAEEAMAEMESKGEYADGGLVGGELKQSSFDPTKWMYPGQSYFGTQTGGAGVGATTGQQEYRIYQNAAGQLISILFVDNVAQQEIPEGYKPQAEMVEQPFRGGDESDSRREEPKEDRTISPEDNYYNMTDAELMAVGNRKGAGLLELLPGLGGGIIGMVANNTAAANMRAAAIVLESRGNTSAAAELRAKADAAAGKSKMGGLIGSVFNNSGVATGEKIAERHREAYEGYSSESSSTKGYKGTGTKSEGKASGSWFDPFESAGGGGEGEGSTKTAGSGSKSGGGTSTNTGSTGSSTGGFSGGGTKEKEEEKGGQSGGKGGQSGKGSQFYKGGLVKKRSK